MHKAQKKLPAKSAAKTKKPRTEKQKAAQFKKGNKANPKGAAAHNPFTKTVRKLTQIALAEITELVMTSSVADVENLLKDKKLTVAQVTILRAALDAAEDGAIDKFNTIVSRSLGAIPTVHHIESPNGTLTPKSVSTDELRNLINEKLEKLASVK